MPIRQTKAGLTLENAMNHAQLNNQDLGGYFDIHPSAVAQWRRRGAPADRADDLSALLGIKADSITSKRTRRRRSGVTTIKQAALPTININGDEYIRAKNVREVIEKAIDDALGRMYG
jgi:hypothetical protein